MNKNNNGTVYRYLLNIKGIGNHRAKQICDRLGMSPYTIHKDLSPSKLENLDRLLANIRKNSSLEFEPKSAAYIENGLSRFKKACINRLIKINSYRGRRIKLGFPARGQRTRSNAVTAHKRIL